VKKLVLIVALGVLLSGCDALNTMSEGLKNSEGVASDLEKSVGSKPFVGFNWNNGSLTNVSVTFEGVPSGKTVQQIATLSRAAIASHFKQPPQKIVISFALPGGT
jgi:hypothetical protein